MSSRKNDEKAVVEKTTIAQLHVSGGVEYVAKKKCTSSFGR